MRLYLRLIAASIRSRMQYRWDFLVTSALFALITAMDFVLVAAILYRYQSVAGWNVYEIALLAGTISASFGLYRMLAAELHLFERYLVTGEFDQLLTRPWPTLASLLARNCDVGRVGGVIQGYLVIAIGLRGVLAQGAPAWLALYVPLLPLVGSVVVAAMGMATAVAGFWITRIDELQNFTLSAPNTAANFPAEIYPQWLRYLLTGALPVLSIGYVPIRYALGKGGGPLSLAVPFLAAALGLGVGLLLWRLGERHYQSTGN